MNSKVYRLLAEVHELDDQEREFFGSLYRPLAPLFEDKVITHDWIDLPRPGAPKKPRPSKTYGDGSETAKRLRWMTSRDQFTTKEFYGALGKISSSFLANMKRRGLVHYLGPRTYAISAAGIAWLDKWDTVQ